jgi:hypothetical protein
MRKLTLIMFLLVVVLLGRQSIAAQTDKPKCDPAAVIAQANTLKSGNDAKKDIKTLLDLQKAITAANIACNGMSFEGKGARVLGPLDFEKGYYKVTVTTAGFFISKLNVVSGKCEGADFNIFSGGANEGTETLLKSEGCKVLIELSNISKPWKLIFEPIEVG